MRLFKYVRAERVDILETERIAFTPPEEFNDVFDTKPKVVPLTNMTLLKQRAKAQEKEAQRHLSASFRLLPRKERRKKQREILKEVVHQMRTSADSIAEQIQTGLQTEINKHFGILCLTTNPDNKLMWGHYADGHRGMVLEFDVKNPRFAITDKEHRVYYSTEPATYDPAVGSQGWWKIKSTEWEYEGEYRITTRLKECEKKILPNGKIIYLHQLPRDCVKAVYMGLKMEEAIKNRLRKICRPSGIELYEAKFLKDGMAYEFRKTE
jgi:hypothetical protein